MYIAIQRIKDRLDFWRERVLEEFSSPKVTMTFLTDIEINDKKQAL